MDKDSLNNLIKNNFRMLFNLVKDLDCKDCPLSNMCDFLDLETDHDKLCFVLDTMVTSHDDFM